MSEFADEPQDVAEQLDEDAWDTGVPEEAESPIEGEVGDLSELLLDGQDVIDTSATQSPEESALHIVDRPEGRTAD